MKHICPSSQTTFPQCRQSYDDEAGWQTASAQPELSLRMLVSGNIRPTTL
jgi:hypothetical protein